MTARSPKILFGSYFVDSLTDIIRPFTESRGLRADQIRLQREDVLIEIAKKTRKRAEPEQVQLKPVPLKLLIPLLEKASTEDVDTEMHDRWAALLLSASNEAHSRHLVWVDILGRMSSDEARILENACFSHKGFPQVSYPRGHMEENRSKLEAGMRRLIIPVEAAGIAGNDGLSPLRRSGLAGDACRKFVDDHNLIYGTITCATLNVGNGGGGYYHADFGVPGSPGYRSLEILERERLLDIERLSNPQRGVTVYYFNLTYLGVSFVRDCSPESSRMAARRPRPVRLSNGISSD